MGDLDEKAMFHACRVMQEHGLDFSHPTEGDLDDAERGRFDALCAAICAYLAALPKGEPESEKAKWQAWARRRLDTSTKFWLRAAKKALDGDTRELRNRVALCEAEPLEVALSAAPPAGDER